ncbi:MAG: hypothetical protein Q4B50_07770 [Bacillota bacterium]|nr:hypothetical protein [Bacillota bacterium]
MAGAASASRPAAGQQPAPKTQESSAALWLALANIANYYSLFPWRSQGQPAEQPCGRRKTVPGFGKKAVFSSKFSEILPEALGYLAPLLSIIHFQGWISFFASADQGFRVMSLNWRARWRANSQRSEELPQGNLFHPPTIQIKSGGAAGGSETKKRKTRLCRAFL